jgi:hypothetical protein
LQEFGCGDDQHAEASGDVGAVGDVAGAGQAQVTLGFDLAVSVFRDALCGRRGRRLAHDRYEQDHGRHRRLLVELWLHLIRLIRLIRRSARRPGCSRWRADLGAIGWRSAHGHTDERRRTCAAGCTGAGR